MKINKTFATLISLAAFLLVAGTVDAQPGGPGGFPGGRPPSGSHGQRPTRRPGQDWNQMQNDPNAQQVKQKKKVKEGDTFKVVGSLRDSVSGEFLPYVNVAVLDSADSAFVKGGSTNLDGYFELTGIHAGAYLLRVSAIGYQNSLYPFKVENNTALGTLKLKPGATTLKEVEITEQKPLYAMDGEKLIYNVSEDPSIQTGTTEDALQNAPGVEVDVEGNISLRGVSSVEIWVNDKPSKLTEENLKTYLQTLPANALARIETITNPSAKYATSAEAVINIITTAHIKSNQFVSFGVNGSNQPFVSPWVSYMWAKEKLSFNLFASGRYSYRKNSSEGGSLQRRDHTPAFTGDTVRYDDVMRQTDTSRSNSGSPSGNIFMSLNYEIDSMQELSVDAGGFYNWSNNVSRRATTQTYYLDTPGSIAYGIIDSTLSHSMFAHAGADWTKKFDNEGHNLRVGLNTRLSHNASDEWYSRDYTKYTLPGSSPADENRYLLSNSNNYGGSLDVRYNRPYSKDGEMSYGFSADHQSTNNNYQRFNDFDQNEIDTLRTYHFLGSESGVDADVDWTHRWGGFTLSTGLGLGANIINYNYQSDMAFADSGSYITYDMHPSIHFTYRTEDMHNFKLNYTMRMSNPDEEDITKFRIYGEDSYRTGNPNKLNPSYTHSMEAGWQKFFSAFGNVGIECYGRWSTNEISSLTDAKMDEYLDRIVSYSMPYNMGSSWRYGTSLNMTYRPTGFFNVRLYANLYNYGYRMDSPKYGRVEDDMWSWSARINAWAKVFDQYQITMSLNYSSPTISLMREQKARYWFNIGARSDFFKRKLSVFVNIQDLFNWGARYGFGSENTNPYYLSSNTNKMLNSRYISAGITLRFGKMELEQSAKEGDSETGDTLGN